MRRIVVLGLACAFGSVAVGCMPPKDRKFPQQPTVATVAGPRPTVPPAKNDWRLAFNRTAQLMGVPVYWTEDKNKNGALDADEVAFVWGLDPSSKESDWISGGRFTQKMVDAYTAIGKRAQSGPTKTGDAKEDARRAAVDQELAQGRPTLVLSDLTSASESDKRIVAHVIAASTIVEQLFQKQKGTNEYAAKIPSDDTASKTLFFRNQSPACEAPLTQDNPACSAVGSGPVGKVSGLYPADLVAQDKFCDTLAKSANKRLMDPFTVVRAKAGATPPYEPIAYTDAYKAEMVEVSKELKLAADSVTDPAEAAFKAYLTAAAQAFLDNNWFVADEAWAKMSVTNSKWYLRIGPDETYGEPCNTKALFHSAFGAINQKSLKWQRKLDPLKTDLENDLANLAGAPYVARKVSFKLPDFIDITLNTGDSRHPRGTTIGQSLPNFGPVANQGRGRTVAMTNFYTDPDSVVSLRVVAESLLCKSAMPVYTTDAEPQLMSTVLHEAAHNLGPAHQYRVQGKVDREVFGGPLASTLEELKAQTAALYFTDWLADKKEISPDDAKRAHVRDLTWAFGHIAQGMYTETKQPKSYSQLAAIQLGWLQTEGAVTWNAGETAANGKDAGCFAFVFDKYPSAVKGLMREVAGIKGRGDKARAESLVRDFVDVSGDKKKVLDTIQERVLRQPKPSFLYSIRL